MTITYRGNGAWGSGKGARLTAAELDGNFWDHEGRIVALEDSGLPGSGDDNPLLDITVSGGTITKYFADSTTATETVSAPSASPYLAISTSTYTVLSSHIGYFLEFTNASGCAITVPTGIAGGLNAEWHFCQSEGCSGLVIAGSGLTVAGVEGFVTETATEGAVVTLKRRGATNSYRLFGGPLVAV